MEAAAMPWRTRKTPPPVMKMYFVLMLAPSESAEFRMQNADRGRSAFVFSGGEESGAGVRVLRREPSAQRRPPTSQMFRKPVLRSGLGQTNSKASARCSQLPALPQHP